MAPRLDGGVVRPEKAGELVTSEFEGIGGNAILQRGQGLADGAASFVEPCYDGIIAPVGYEPGRQFIFQQARAKYFPPWLCKSLHHGADMGIAPLHCPVMLQEMAIFERQRIERRWRVALRTIQYDEMGKCEVHGPAMSNHGGQTVPFGGRTLLQPRFDLARGPLALGGDQRAQSAGVALASV